MSKDYEEDEDDDWTNDDICYECKGYGDDFYYDEKTDDLVCRCFECPFWED